MNLRIGQGYDVHRLVEGRELWLCGIKLEHTLGLLGHSDADVAIHALCDAIFGALGMRDIGYHFPDTDPQYKGIDSKILLAHTVSLMEQKGYAIGNVDITIAAERPKINPHIPEMRTVLASILHTAEENVAVKATTTERLGFVGREEGISATAIVLLAANEA